MICPKCGFEQPDAPECARCGIIIAKYKVREEAPESGPPPEAIPPPPPPPPAQDTAPGWARPGTGPEGQDGQLGSRYAPIDQQQFKQAQAQAALRKFIGIIAIIGGIVLVLSVGLSFFSVYNEFAKLEIDVNNFMEDLSDTTPPAVHDNIMKFVKKRGFEVKGGDFEIQITGAGGQDVAQLTEMMPGNMIWNLDAKVEFDVVGKGAGFFPITLTIRSSMPFVLRDSAAALRSYMGLEPLSVPVREVEEEYDEEYYYDEVGY